MGSPKQALNAQRKQQRPKDAKPYIDKYLGSIYRMVDNLENLAMLISADGFPLASSLVLEAADSLRDISWMDFRADQIDPLDVDKLGAEDDYQIERSSSSPM